MSARVAAVQTISRVVDDMMTLELALEQLPTTTPAHWVPTIRSLSYGAIRGFFRYEAVLARLLSQPVESIGGVPRALFCMALFELEDAITPQYAVVDAAVKSARLLGLAKLSGLINAVLRRYLRERVAIDLELARNPAVRHAFPDWLAMQIRADWPVRWTQVLAACDRQAPLWLRVNPLKTTPAEYLQMLRAAGKNARASPVLGSAIELQEACEVRELPGFAQGLVSVQDLGAQLVAFPLALAANLRVLDACAAPGGKTCLIGEQHPNLSLLAAADVDPARLRLVRDNLNRTGVAAQIFAADMALPAAWWDGKPFDRILLDVPCSALGVIRRHPDIRLRRKTADIDAFAATQARLLRAAWPLLAAGGRIVYVSCTVTRRENRDLIGAFLQNTPAASTLPVNEWLDWPGLGEADGVGVQILPGEAGADGFYYAAIGKQ